MTAPARTPRIAAARVRLAVLAALVAGHLPVPVVHSHAALASSGASGLARHLAVFHGGAPADPSRHHMHVVPPMFFGGLGDATGDDLPDPGRPDAPVPQAVQVDGSFTSQAAGLLPCAAGPAAPWTGGPTHFLETLAEGRDLGGLLGVRRC